MHYCIREHQVRIRRSPSVSLSVQSIFEYISSSHLLPLTNSDHCLVFSSLILLSDDHHVSQNLEHRIDVLFVLFVFAFELFFHPKQQRICSDKSCFVSLIYYHG